MAFIFKVAYSASDLFMDAACLHCAFVGQSVLYGVPTLSKAPNQLQPTALPQQAWNVTVMVISAATATDSGVLPW